MQILFEDNHLIAVAKPAGVLSAHFQGAEETLDRIVKAYLKDKYKKPGKVFLGVVHRLDRPVSGVLLFARTSKSAARLAEQFRTGVVEKIYWAIVEGKPPHAGHLEDWLKQDPYDVRVRVVSKGTPTARRSVVTFRTLHSSAGWSWLELRPETGRKHQLRVQLSQLGHPIVGDRKYGATSRFDGALALHARSLTFLHPISREPVTVTAPLPDAWFDRFSFLPR